MPNLHPMFVHLPIALLTASWVFDVAGIIVKREDLVRSGWWTLIAGVIGLTATIITGIVAKASVAISDGARGTFETHEELAFAVAGLYSVLVLWRVAHKTSIPSNAKWMYLLLSCAGVVLVWTTGWFGGELVFQFGVGVQR